VSEDNKAMVRRLVEAINAGEEVAAVEELFAPRTARRVKRLFAEFRWAFPDWREKVVQLIAEGDTVAGRFRCSGTHLGEFLGNPPTGKRMEVEEVFFLRRAEGGGFVDFWGLEDSLGGMQQLGLLPSRSSR
jgi:predicted ester cyclase